MNFKLPKIYPITDRGISGISHAEQVEKLIQGGATLIQLREKNLSPRDFCESAATAIAIARPCGVRIIINDRVDIALAVKADGVHLGQDDLPPEEARRILGPDSIIGFSTHSLDQAAAALRLAVDYVAIGPVFPTRTKENPANIVGIEGVSAVKKAVGDFPLVAIGGINSSNVRAVLNAGADSAALISGLLSNPDTITSTMRSFLDL